MNWISVEERLPEYGKCILLYSDEGGVAEGALNRHGFWEQWRWSAKLLMSEVTHWTPLPPPPKQNEE